MTAERPASPGAVTPPAPTVAVAYSGGRDSSALLHATLLAAGPLGLRVVALHVHHGLMPQADAWVAHCETQCRRWRRAGLPVELQIHRVQSSPQRGESVEAWARTQRYRALHRMAREHGAGLVLLGHHQRDQAETLLLQALRGAGVAGLAGMPAVAERDGVTWARPWLHRPREAVEAYVAHHGLQVVDDGSNDDPRFARNRLRALVWPALLSAFPAAQSSLADAARWAAEASACLDELAAIDLGAVQQGETIAVAAWLGLSNARRANVLRAWLRQRLGGAAPGSLVRRLMDELPAALSARWPAPGAEVRLHRGRLSCVGPVPADVPATPQDATPLCIRRAGTYRAGGWPGRLRVTRVASGGVPLAWLAQACLRPRRGAEQFQAGIGRPPRSLKKQFQAAGLDASARAGPLLYSGGQLLFVPGLGLDARAVGLPGQALVQIEWLPSERT